MKKLTILVLTFVFMSGTLLAADSWGIKRSQERKQQQSDRYKKQRDDYRSRHKYNNRGRSNSKSYTERHYDRKNRYRGKSVTRNGTTRHWSTKRYQGKTTQRRYNPPSRWGFNRMGFGR